MILYSDLDELPLFATVNIALYEIYTSVESQEGKDSRNYRFFKK